MLNLSLFNVEIPAKKSNLFKNVPFVTKYEEVSRGFIFKFKDFFIVIIPWACSCQSFEFQLK